MVKAIVCVGKNWEIGKKNGLLFHIKADMGFFRTTTENCIVVMGENTLLSFPGSKPLKNRVNIVLCPEGHEYEDCICYHDFDELVKAIQALGKILPVFIIGGAMFYKSMLPYCDEVYVTKVNAEDKEATAFFPNLDKDENFVVRTESAIIEEGDYKFKFVFYINKKLLNKGE